MEQSAESQSLGVRDFLQPRVAALLFLGFSAGLPLLLIFSTLSIWLREVGLERATMTYFSWAALGYSFKYVWAPLVDKLPFPVLSSRLGQRRAWMLVAQCAVIAAIVLMAHSDPATPQGLQVMALGAVALGFSSATQDIVIDAYRIEAAEGSESALGLLSGAYMAGYRCGMVVAGAGALVPRHRFRHDCGELSPRCLEVDVSLHGRRDAGGRRDHADHHRAGSQESRRATSTTPPTTRVSCSSFALIAGTIIAVVRGLVRHCG